MSEAIQIRMGGYGPPTTTHSRALKFIGDRLEERFGERVDVKYIWNIMDFGYRSSDIMWLTECGILTLSYQSTSYLTKRVSELGFVDQPFLFPDLEAARAAFDGVLGNRPWGRQEWLLRRNKGTGGIRGRSSFHSWSASGSKRVSQLKTRGRLSESKQRGLIWRVRYVGF